MTIRTEGQLVLAANMAQDLTNIVVAYLNLYRQHAQGLNGVRIPDESYTVVFRRIKKEGMLPVKLVYTKTTTWEVPTYYDVDSDYFQEGFGASNVSGYDVKSENHIEEYDLNIPFAALLASRDVMEQEVKAFAVRKKAELREQERLAEIARHQAAIVALQSNKGATDGAVEGKS